MNSSRNNRSGNKNNTSPRIVNYYTSGQGPSMASIVFSVLIVITIAVIFYYAYTVYNKTPKAVEKEIITSAVDSKIQYNIPGSGLPTSQFSNEYTISMWLKVSDYSYRYGEKKVILRRGTGDTVNPEISLGGRDNNLVVNIGLSTQKILTRGTDRAVEKFKNMEQMLVEQSADDTNKDFGSVSNNNVIPLNRMIYNIDTSDACYMGTSVMRGSEQKKYLLETFSNNSQLVDILSRMIISMCDAFNAMEEPETAKIMLDALDSTFDQIPTPTSGLTVTNALMSFDNFLAQNSNKPSIARIKTAMDIIKSKLEELITLNPPEEDLADSLPAINEAIKNANCNLTIDSPDITSMDKLMVSIKKMAKKMYYQVLYNLGVAVAEEHGSEIKMRDGEMSDKLGQCVIRQFPLQRWTHVAVCVMNQNVNLYQDGRLVSSCVMDGFPQIQTGDVVLFPDGGISGKMSKLMYSNMALNQEQINNIYANGPSTSSSLWDTIPNWLIYVGISLASMLLVLMIIS